MPCVRKWEKGEKVLCVFADARLYKFTPHDYFTKLQLKSLVLKTELANKMVKKTQQDGQTPQ